MNQIKINNFKESHPNTAFPFCSSLSKSEMEKLRGLIIQNMGFSDKGTTDLLKLTLFIDNLSNCIEDLDANSDQFDLFGVFKLLKIPIVDKVFINWYQYDDIDCLKLADLAKFFHDIWYPSSDDIDIFDETCAWIISIHHHGGIKFWKK